MTTKQTATLDDCYNRAMPDEPYFTLLGRDPDAAEAVRYWVMLRQARIGRGEKPLDDTVGLAEALQCAADMVVWRSEATDPSKHSTPLWRQQKPAVDAFADIPARSVTVEGLSAEATSRWIEKCGEDVCRITVGEDADLSELTPEGYYLYEVGTGYAEFRRNQMSGFYDTDLGEIYEGESSTAVLDIQPKMLSRSRISEFLDYATSYGEFDENTPDGTVCPVGGTPMNESRRISIFIYKRVLGLLDENAVYPATPSIATSMPNSIEVRHTEPSDKPMLDACKGKADSDMVDVTQVPGLPPHRFTLFEKSKYWAYGRGLEINPSHIPTMLDRMQEDGYHLQAVFGGITADKVGMLFRRQAVSTNCANCGTTFPDDGRSCPVCNGVSE